MAEFASAIVALVATGATTSNTLYRIIDSWRNAPADFQSLSNSVTDLRGILHQVERLEANGELPDSSEPRVNDYITVIERANVLFLKVDQLSEKLHNSKVQNGSSKFRKRIWMLYKTRAARLKSETKQISDAFLGLLAVDNAGSGRSVRIAVQAIQLETVESKAGMRRIEQEVSGLKDQLSGQESLTQRYVQLFSETQNAVSTRLEETNFKVTALLQSQTLMQEDSRSKGASPHSKPLEINRHKTFSRLAIEAPPLTPLECLRGCECRCHLTFSSAFLRGFSTFIGCLFIGYKSLPWSYQNRSMCSEQTCRRSQPSAVTFRWYFPSWFLGLVFEAGIGRALKPMPLFAAFRVRYSRKTTDPIFIAIISLDIPATQKILENGEASIYDTDENGLGLLWKVGHAQRGNQFEMYRFLLDQGCPNFGEAEVDWSPAENLLVDALAMGSLDQPSSFSFDYVSTICTFFRMDALDFWQSWRLDEPQTGLENFLLARPQSNTLEDVIDEPDSYGNSALVWAVQYGSLQAVKLLLDLGADKHQSTAGSGVREPLLNLAVGWATDPEPIGDYRGVIKLLLGQGLDPNKVDTRGFTAIHVAAMWGSLVTLELLAQECTGEIDWCARTPDGENALQLARRYFESSGKPMDERLCNFLSAEMSQQQASTPIDVPDQLAKDSTPSQIQSPMPGSWQ